MSYDTASPPSHRKRTLGTLLDTALLAFASTACYSSLGKRFKQSLAERFPRLEGGKAGRGLLRLPGRVRGWCSAADRFRRRALFLFRAAGIPPRAPVAVLRRFCLCFGGASARA